MGGSTSRDDLPVFHGSASNFLRARIWAGIAYLAAAARWVGAPKFHCSDLESLFSLARMANAMVTSPIDLQRVMRRETVRGVVRRWDDTILVFGMSHNETGD